MVAHPEGIMMPIVIYYDNNYAHCDYSIDDLLIN